MATQTTRSHPWRSLATLGVLLATLFGVVAGGWYWSSAQWTPKLALDLEGGTEIILTPQTTGDINAESITQAVSIIRQRVNGSGVSEAEVTRQGSQNILVALPGNPDEETLNLVKKSAQLTFRPVLQVGQGFVLPDPTTSIDPSAAASADPSAPAAVTDGATLAPATPGDSLTVTATDPAASSATASPTATATTQGRPAIKLPAAAAATPTSPLGTTPAADPAVAVDPTAAADPSAAATSSAAATPTGPSDLAWITPEIQQKFTDLNCFEGNATAGGQPAQDEQPLVACSTDGAFKYILGPVELTGESVTDAVGTQRTTSQGFTTGQWIVQLSFNGEGTKKFGEITQRLFGYGQNSDQNRFAIVLDNVVVSAPGINEPILAGNAEISGSFTQETSQTLANQLKFGALPISFTVQTQDKISATLGSEQLQRGLLAGAIGLVLVVVYSLIQYRALGLVTVASLVVVGVVTYGALLFLSWRQGYRLSLAGVAGLIVAIGITADSFIVYFERIRDEVRDGRSLPTAVEVGWERARRTILASDMVSFLAAIVLYTLAVGGVRGFAFTLGLTTIIDLVIVFLFTKPMVTLLSRRKFFANGHPLSGFDPEHLGSVVARSAIRSGAPRGTPKPAPRPVSEATT